MTDDMSESSHYFSGWINCNCCGGNVPCVVMGNSKIHPAMILAGQRGIIRPRLCPNCGERYSIRIRPEFYFKRQVGVPDGVLAVFLDEGIPDGI